MKIIAKGKYVKRDDGTTWPTPMVEAETSLEWRLRYASPEQLVKDRFLAASIVAAYHELIAAPVKKRNAVLADLRRALNGGTGQ
jgi:hypothetical protein